MPEARKQKVGKGKSAADRQDGTYRVPVTAEPQGGPIPTWTGGKAPSAGKKPQNAG